MAFRFGVLGVRSSSSVCLFIYVALRFEKEKAEERNRLLLSFLFSFELRPFISRVWVAPVVVLSCVVCRWHFRASVLLVVVCR